MATLTSAVITIPSFTGLKAVASTKANNCTAAAKAPAPSMHLCKASLKEVAVAVAAFSASALLTSNALAMEVLLGGNDGSLVFVPSEFKVASGEKIVFRNNAGFPHNVMFYEDQVPAGVDVSKISMGEDELLNAPNEIYSVTLDIKGAYGFYCYPHEGAGMVGTLFVN